jgi:hypothetical protein
LAGKGLAGKDDQLAAELAMQGGGTGESEMPRLDAFDEEFGGEPVAILRGQRRKGRLRFLMFVALLLCAGAASALAFAWRNGDTSWLRFEVQSAPSLPQLASREGTDDQVVRLRRQVEALQREIGELTEAQQRATDTIASLRAEQEAPAASAYWYSDLGALNYGIANPRPAGLAPPRSATARSELRTRRRDTGGGTPLSLEAPQ